MVLEEEARYFSLVIAFFTCWCPSNKGIKILLGNGRGKRERLHNLLENLIIDELFLSSGVHLSHHKSYCSLSLFLVSFDAKRSIKRATACFSSPV